jgi:hypothetical protein
MVFTKRSTRHVIPPASAPSPTRSWPAALPVPPPPTPFPLLLLLRCPPDFVPGAIVFEALRFPHPHPLTRHSSAAARPLAVPYAPPACSIRSPATRPPVGSHMALVRHNHSIADPYCTCACHPVRVQCSGSYGTRFLTAAYTHASPAILRADRHFSIPPALYSPLTCSPCDIQTCAPPWPDGPHPSP